MTDSPAPPPFTDAPPNQAWVTVPVAEVIPAPGHARAFRLMTVIIMILLAGLLGAIGWWWWHSRGLEVSIEFERPHGLQIGASVMLNGVQVGEVRDIAILENHRIQVRTRLTAKPDINSMIARAGTQFWIPRFSADLTRGVRNVQAVFATHVEVNPGTGPRQRHFTGLEQEPPTMWLRDGDLPIVLRASRNQGVTEGSAVFYRGLEIGKIVRTQLSRDSSTFEAWLRIDAQYRMLVHNDSRFVDSSGLRVDVGLGGMTLDLDSLQSVLAGSVQLYTPTSSGDPAEAGREFVLEPDADPEYATWAPYIDYAGYQPMHVAALQQIRPTPIAATLTWKYPRALGLIDAGEGTRQGLVLSTRLGVLVPTNMVDTGNTSATDVVLDIAGTRCVIDDQAVTWRGEGLALCVTTPATVTWPVERIRQATEPETCTLYGPGGLDMVINREYLDPTAPGWRITRDDAFNAGWNGAIVLSNRDHAVIGMLAVDEKNRGMVMPIPGGFPP